LKRSLILALSALALSVATVPALAQQSVPVQFARGATSATVKGTIKGDQYRDYTVNARAGQTLTVALTNPDGRAFFNVLPPGSADEAVFVGSSSGNSFRGPVPGNGNTTIRVYQMRATARRGEVASYTLTIGVAGSGSSASGGGAASGARPARFDDLVGTDSIRAFDVMTGRGFTSVDSFQTGEDLIGIWWNGRTRQCVQVISRNNRVAAASDIQTHPKCR
jgi:hypothetical protein